jgi:hypothetical protein
MAGRPLARLRDSTPEKSFSLVRDAGGAAVWRCGHTKQGIDGKWRRCSFRTRKERIQNGHTHEYRISRENDPDFPRDFDQKQADVNFHMIQKEFLGLSATAAAQMNISARTAASDTMFNFCKGMMSLGIRTYLADHSFRPEILQPFCDKTVAQEMLKVADDVFMRRIDSIAEDIKFVNIYADAGTVLSFHTVHALIGNPHYPNSMTHFDSFENRNYDSTDYESFFQGIVNKARGVTLEVCSVVIDNLPAQFLGLSDFLQTVSGKGIIHVPCFCHMTNLVFTYALKSQHFARWMIRIRGLVGEFRSDVACTFLGRRCPGLVETRWCYVVDCLHFLLKKRDDVAAALIGWEQEPMPKEFEYVYQILLPLKLFSLAMEENGRCLCDVIPLVNELIHEYSIIEGLIGKSEEIQRLLNFVTAHFFARLYVNSWGETQTAYLLSPAGRQSFRATYTGWDVRGKVDKIPYVHECVTEMRERFDNWLRPWEEKPTKEIDRDLSLIQKDSAWVFQNDAEEELPVIHPMKNGKETRYSVVAIRRKGFQGFLKKEFQKSTIQRLRTGLDLSQIWLSALPILQKMAKDLGCEGAEQRIRNWLGDKFDKNLMELLNCREKPDPYWRKLFCQAGSVWQSASQIAMRFISAGTSEAEVERTLSRQKDIQGLHGTNFGTAILDARLTLMAEQSSGNLSEACEIP